MEKGYKILGNYIRLVDERNKDLSVTKLLGVSISKKFIPSIANIVGTDLSNYKIVRTGQFAYGPVTSRNGEKISIAYLDEEDCMGKMMDLQEKHGEIIWYSGLCDEDYVAGQYIGRENFVY